VHCVLPSLSGVSIEFPTVVLLGSSPVRDFEALEEGTGASIEVHLTDTLKKGIRVEVLSENMMLNIGLLVEFIAIEVLNSNTYIILN
jgi:hypothetical protein